MEKIRKHEIEEKRGRETLRLRKKKKERRRKEREKGEQNK